MRQVHPRFKTPYVAILVFSGIAALAILPGELTFLATIYSFGATLSFTVAHVSVIRLRQKYPDRERPWKPPGNVRIGGVSGAADRGLRRDRHLRRVHRRDGARPGHPARRRRLDGAAGHGLRALPPQPGAAADPDGEGAVAGAARGRGGRVQERAGRLRGRPVPRGDRRDRRQAGGAASPWDPRDLADQRAPEPAPRRPARRERVRGAGESRAREADRRRAGHRPYAADPAGAGGPRDHRRGDATSTPPRS